MKYVIVGNGVASIGAIESIRKYDTKGDILVVGQEPVPTYGRPLISYLLAGKVGYDGLALRPESFYAENNVEMKLGTTVTAIDTKAKTIKTDKAESIKYDRLLLATGGKPFQPNIPGLEGSDVYNFINLAHAETLMTRVKTVKKAAVIGAGLIALKASEALNTLGIETTLIVRSRIMRTYFDETAGDLLVDHLKSKGLMMKLKASPTEILRNEQGRVVGVATDKGTVDCDMVIVAAGVRPNIELAEKAGLKTDKGILVDNSLCTSNDKVYAAGDAAEAPELLSGKPAVIPIWPNAYQQGRFAGKNMCGVKESYPGTLSMNSIAYFGLPTASAGIVDPPADDASYVIFTEMDEMKRTYRKLVFQKDRLVGYVLIGEVDHAGFYTGFVRFQISVDDDTKELLKQGQASAIMWPADLFDEQWNPATEHVSG